jgi:hypothetical protein
MTLPDGYRPELDRQKYCVLLDKAIYGLKQSGREWNLNIDGTIKRMGFTRCVLAPCLYVKRSNNSYSLLAIHVDDAILASTSKEELGHMKRQLE